MSYYRVNIRYANALLADAKRFNQLEKVYQDAVDVISICQNNRDLIVLLKNPTIQSSKKQIILVKLFTGKISSIMLVFIKLITRHKREMYLIDILRKFVELYKEKRGILEAKIVSALPLDDDILKKVKKFIISSTEYKDVDMVNEIDKNLLGGFALKYKDKLLDLSVQNQLNSLRKHLLE